MKTAGYCSDFKAIGFPKLVSWAEAGAVWFLNLFDWDTVQILEDRPASLSFDLILCTRFFPCNLNIFGSRYGVIKQSGNGYFSCQSSMGCAMMIFEYIEFRCEFEITLNSIIIVQGSILEISNSSFVGCNSNMDGGGIHSFGQSTVLIRESKFRDMHSFGFGGAISAFGSSLLISNSDFHNCSSRNGGGAIWSAAFKSCYGSLETHSTSIHIISSSFTRCSTAGAGGAVLAFAESVEISRNVERLELKISLASFINCTSDQGGGALSASGYLIQVELLESTFHSCSSSGSGGAVSAENIAGFSFSSNNFYRNVAYGFGGGAIYLKNLSLSLLNSTCVENSAPFGGGGALYWEKTIWPAKVGCPKGMRNVNISCSGNNDKSNSDCVLGSCEFCDTGKYQAQENTEMECVLCVAGKYSDSAGLSACYSCTEGKYSSLGSDGCTPCAPGFYSDTEAIRCSVCSSGVYKSAGIHQDITAIFQCPPQKSEVGVIGRTPESGTYDNSEQMYWLVAPENAVKIILKFNFFQTELKCDFLSIYQCQYQNCSADISLLGKFSGSELPYPITCLSGAMLIVWTSDHNTTLSGWNASYVSYGMNASQNQTETRSNSNLTRSLVHSEYGYNSLRNSRQDTNSPFFALIDTRWVGGQQKDEPGPGQQALQLESIPGHNLGQNLGNFDVKAVGLSKYVNRRYEHVHMNDSAIDGTFYMAFCVNNTAKYGKCLASSPKRLKFNLESSVFPGVSFTFSVIKQDAYNQTIKSDSSSILEAILSDQNLEATNFSAVVGINLAKLQNGVGFFSFAIKPTFTANVNLRSSQLRLISQTYLHISGKDSETGAYISSTSVPLNISGCQFSSGLVDGRSICPSGFILSFDNTVDSGRQAVCTRCKPGKYSLNPLASPGSAADPECMNCPTGGDCSAGGDNVTFKVGEWKIFGDLYILQSCPPGFSLINAKSVIPAVAIDSYLFSPDDQQCSKCGKDQYILNPNTDPCKFCPPGLHCRGDGTVIPLLDNSIWVKDDSVYLLLGCPTGYKVISNGVIGAFDDTVQRCDPCLKGEECILPPCVTCRKCQAGFYKDAVSVEPCLPCPPNTYVSYEGAQEISSCQACPADSSTKLLNGQKYQESCKCDIGFYSVVSNGQLRCIQCPPGILFSQGLGVRNRIIIQLYCSYASVGCAFV